MDTRRIILIVLAIKLTVASSSVAQFTDATVEFGVDHYAFSPTLIGGGIGIIDVNNDGWDDLYLAGGLSDDELYINMYGKGFTEEASSYIPPYIRSGAQTTGVAVGDINRDGLDDLYVTTINDAQPNYLLLNSGDGFFIDISSAAGIRETSPSSGAILVDINLDGFLDIYVLNYVDEVRFIRDSISNLIVGFDHDCAANTLYFNNGDLTFTDVTDLSGTAGLGCALAGMESSFVNRPEGIYVANDYGEWIEPNELFSFDSSGGGSNISKNLGLDVPLYGMGIAPSDFDRDGDFDLYITNIGANAFMVQEDSLFTDEALAYHNANVYAIQDSLLATSWGANFFDYDHDGWEDLFVANGFIPSSQFIPTWFLDPNKLYRNLGGQRFIDVSEMSDMDFTGVNRGSVTTDIDLDGDIDLIVSTVVGGEPDDDPQQRSKVYMNQNAVGNYLKLNLLGTQSNPNAYGAQLTLFDHNSKQSRLLYSGGTHASQSSQIIHFGLDSTEVVDSIQVKWPLGSVQMYYGLQANRTYQLVEGETNASILGCTNPDADNYNPEAQVNSGCGEVSTNTVDIRDADFIQIHPNPATNYLSILSDEGPIESIRIIDIVGHELDIQFGENQPIDVSHLIEGIYLVVIRIDGVDFQTRFIIQRD